MSTNPYPAATHWRIGAERAMSLDRPILMGILNLTPDSFSDGGRYDNADAALNQVERMLAEGADVIDVGGESTRPGAERIDEAEQIRRTAPVIERLAARFDVPISIDTTRSAVAEAALEAGATIINDVAAGREDARQFVLAAERHAGLILMHMRGEPATMQSDPTYADVVMEVRDFLLDRAAAAEAVGVAPDAIMLDPGIGFGKTLAHNLQLLGALNRFVETGYPVMLGASRKRFLGTITGCENAADRAAATAASTALGVQAGVRVFRVHDVRPNRHAADVSAAVAAHRHGPTRVD